MNAKLKTQNSKLKVYIGLSGGVDSAAAAALLKKQGYNVTGVFICIWNPVWGECNWKDERRDAMRVALHLSIPFQTLDLSREYQRDVADYMIAEYKAGRTPNPDVLCNSQIKFGAFLDWAKSEGADYVATGHYARLKREAPISNFQITNTCLPARQESKIINHKSKIRLLWGVDGNKDQSYFLWQLNQDQLKHCLFPVGEYKKSEVRLLAKKFKLPNAAKKDSQGICFIGRVGMKDFLKKYIEEKRGDVLDEKGNIIGYHAGAFFLTIGQRHGFTITKKGTADEPYYVIYKNSEKNTVTVAQKSEEQIVNGEQSKNIVINKVNWIAGEPDEKKKYQARWRYRQPLQECNIKKVNKKGEYKIIFTKELDFVASGQSLVIYHKEQCIGGGVICEL